MSVNTILRFAGSRFRFPQLEIAASATEGNLATISEITTFTPGYAIRSPQFLFPGYRCDGPVREANGANTVTVMFSVQFGGTGPWITGTVGGNSVFSVDPGDNLWSDSGCFPDWLPARTQITVRTLISVDDGESYLVGMHPITSGGGVTEYLRQDNDVSNLMALLGGGAIESNGINSFYGPAMIVGKANKHVTNLPRSVLVCGDSITIGGGDLGNVSADAHNNKGMFAVGLDAEGWGANMIGYSGCRLKYDSTTGFAKRLAAIQALPELPFDTVVQEALVVDNALNLPLAQLQGYLDTWIAAARGYFPGCKLVQTTLLPNTEGGPFSTQAGQTVDPFNAYPSGTLFGLRDYVMTNAGGTLDGFIDLTPTFWAQGNPNASDARDKWRTANDTLAYTGDGTHPRDNGYALGAAFIQNLCATGGL